MRKKIAELISTVFFIGKVKYAPGTFGSLPAFPLCYIIKSRKYLLYVALAQVYVAVAQV